MSYTAGKEDWKKVLRSNILRVILLEIKSSDRVISSSSSDLTRQKESHLSRVKGTKIKEKRKIQLMMCCIDSSNVLQRFSTDSR